jgi:hypothetical protein
MRSIGGQFGCLTAFLMVAAFIFPLLFGWVWSGAHCEPIPQCQQQGTTFFSAELAALAVVAAAAGFAVRCVIKRFAAGREDQGTSTAFIVRAAVAALLATCAFIAAVYLLLVGLAGALA